MQSVVSPLPALEPSWTDASPTLLLQVATGARACEILEVVDKALCLSKLKLPFRRRK